MQNTMTKTKIAIYSCLGGC